LGQISASLDEIGPRPGLHLPHDFAEMDRDVATFVGVFCRSLLKSR